ncbi:ribbon-helix-helix domain-containing protein [Candidatus Woesearchaeota archaeon]|nr:ribbon-helix-helix domain-containing protein [Candidatus Woesearchaeota archaeon]
MAGDLIHIRIGGKLKKEIQRLIDEGIFDNQAEATREAVRDLVLKYKKFKGEDEK